MSFYIILIVISCYLIGVVPNALYDVHNLQLNSYRTERYRRWMQQEPLRSIHLSALLGLVPLLLWGISSIAAMLCWSLFHLLLFITRDQSPQKKKLVITNRVQRLLATEALLISFIVVLGWQLSFILSVSPDFLLLATLSLIGGLSPLVLCISNTVMQPIEKGIGHYYCTDAQKFLKAHQQLMIIGITGSYGKTSTKFILQQCLSTHFNSLMTPESFNTMMGVVRVVRSLLRPIHEKFIVEMGARQQGDIKEICNLVHPNIGIITAIGEQHLETFIDVETIAQTKLELFSSLGSKGVAFYNADDVVLSSINKPNEPHYITYAIDNQNADYRCIDLINTAKGTEFTVLTKHGDKVPFHTRLLGKHNVYNMLAAIAVSVELGIPLSDLIVPIAGLQPIAHRLDVKKTTSGVTILDNAFSSNPQGAKYSLEVLATIEGVKKIMITPGMVELGSREKELNKVFGIQAAEVCDYIILVGAKRTIPIQEGLLEAGYLKSQIYIATNLADGQKHLDSIVQTGDVVLYENDLPDTYNEIKS